MTANSDYAKKLIAALVPLPTAALKQAASAAYSAMLMNTVQDSGQAAYNWKTSVNKLWRQPYDNRYGQGPVGYKGEKRSSYGSGVGPEVVVEDRERHFRDKLSEYTALSAVWIYNPIQDEEHEFHAGIQTAFGIGTAQDWLNSVSEVAANAELRRRWPNN